MASAIWKRLLPCAAALALGACGQDDSPPTDEVGVSDESGGELIVSTPDPNAVPVTVPDTPMTPVPGETAAPTATVTTPLATPAPAASPTVAD